MNFDVISPILRLTPVCRVQDRIVNISFNIRRPAYRPAGHKAENDSCLYLPLKMQSCRAISQLSNVSTLALVGLEELIFHGPYFVCVLDLLPPLHLLSMTSLLSIVERAFYLQTRSHQACE